MPPGRLAPPAEQQISSWPSRIRRRLRRKLSRPTEVGEDGSVDDRRTQHQLTVMVAARWRDDQAQQWRRRRKAGAVSKKKI